MEITLSKNIQLTYGKYGAALGGLVDSYIHLLEVQLLRAVFIILKKQGDLIMDNEELKATLENLIDEYNKLIKSLKEKHKEADALLKKMRLEYNRMLKMK